MSDCSPLRLAENGHSSPSQSSSSQTSQQQQQKHHQQQKNRNRDNRQCPNIDSERSHRNRTGGDVVELTRSQSDSSSKSGHLRYGARNVIELFIPVSLCMLIVVTTIKITDSYKYSSQTIIWYAKVMFTDQTVDTGTRVWQSFANAFIMLIMIVIMTSVLIFLYKFRCYVTIHGWLILSSVIILFIFNTIYIAEILKVFNIPMDNYTMMVFIWNYGAVGMICVHWKGPLLLQQGYLITISALLALIFIRCLPDWTTWTVLLIVSVWDLVAVLCPRGPLRILVETAQERNEPIFPALIYSSTMMWKFSYNVVVSTTSFITMADSDRAPSCSNREHKSNRSRRNRQRPGDNQILQSPSTSNRARTHRTDMGTPTKRTQYPVEIHYEEGVQPPPPPEVEIVEPAMTDNSENWTTPTVRAVSNRSHSQRTNAQNRQTAGAITSEATATEVTINFQPHGSQAAQHMEEERGVKLGLGDFIFFSLLVGKASSDGDWVITLSCYVAILVGLCLTLSLLAVFRKALPALPISIAFGLSSFFMSYVFAAPFAEKLAINQVFV